MGVNVAGSRGRGSADGNDVNWRNTAVSAGEKAIVTSGADLALQGATVDAPRVIAKAGGKLRIDSLQDTSTYTSEQKQIGGSLTIGTAPSANLNFSDDSADSSYRSVNQSTGIHAGDGGFNVSVAGDTALNGGRITSSQAAVDSGANHFSTGGELTVREIENRARYVTKATSISLGTGFSPQGKLAPIGTGVGMGKDSDSIASVTRSGISEVVGDKKARTGDKPSGVSKIFDADRVKKEVRAQSDITQMFSTLAPKTVAAFAEHKISELQAQQSKTKSAPKDDELEQEIEKWKDGGVYRVALHTAVGGAIGGLQGAAGAGSSAAITPKIAGDLEQSKLPDPVKTALVATVGTLVGAVAGGASGAATALGETANNFLSHAEARKREQAIQKLQACKDTSCKQNTQKEIDYWNNLDRWRDQEVTSACLSPASKLCQTWHSALVDASQSYAKNYSAREDLTGSIANERSQVNNQEFQYRQQINHPTMVGVARGLMKLTPPGILLGVSVAAYKMTTSILEEGTIDTAVAIAQGIKELPADLLVRINSKDPTIQGEAFVDTMALGWASTVIVGRLNQITGKSAALALEKQAALDAEIIATEKQRIENNAFRDGAHFESNIDGGLPRANLRLEYEEAIRNILPAAKKMLREGKSEEEVAIWAVNRRDEIKIQYKDLTSPQLRAEIEIRNIRTYNNPNGPDLQTLRAAGKSWAEIIQGAAKPGGKDMKNLSPPGF